MGGLPMEYARVKSALANAYRLPPTEACCMAMAGTSDGPPTYACCRAMAGVVDVRWALPGTCCLQLHGQLETCGHPLGAQRQAHAFHGQIVPGQLEDMSMAATAANLVAGTLRHLWHDDGGGGKIQLQAIG